MGRELTRFDEFPRHQIGNTFDTVVDGSQHWSDGFYFTMGDDAGRVAWFMGLRLHINNDVIDGFVCTALDGRQHNMRWSRRLRPAIDDIAVGPMSVEIVEGLRTLRTVCAANEHGQAYDLSWEGVHAPYNEDHVQVYVNGRLHSDRSNYDQVMRVNGWIEVGGERIEVNDWTGVRDHSWGIGNQTGGPRTNVIAPPPVHTAPPGLRQWCWYRMPDRCIFWQFHHAGAKAPYTKLETRCVYPYGDPRESFAYTSLDYEVEFVKVDGRNSRRLKSSVVHLTRPDGVVESYRSEPISFPLYLQGGGYHNGFDDALGRGVYRGDLHHEGEVWEIDRVTSIVTPKPTDLNRWHYAEAWGRCTNLADARDSGTGHLESVVLGPYEGL